MRPWHPELAKVGMRVLSKSFQRLRVSAPGLLTGTSTQGSVIGLILQPLKSLSVYSNSKMVAGTRDTDELKTFAWDNEDV